MKHFHTLLFIFFISCSNLCFAYDGNTSTNDSTQTNISIFPNPNNGQFTLEISGYIETQFAKISIISIYGKTVFEEEYQKVSLPFELEYDFRNLPKGMYFVQIEMNGEGTSYRMIIQ